MPFSSTENEMIMTNTHFLQKMRETIARFFFFIIMYFINLCLQELRKESGWHMLLHRSTKWKKQLLTLTYRHMKYVYKQVFKE